jgi:hypothetical protein
MSDNTSGGDTPIVNDAITAEDTGFDSNVEKNFNESGSESIAQAPAELQDKIEEAIEEGADEEEIKDLIKEYELKVNGKTVKKKVNLSDDKEMQKLLQLAEVSQMSMQQRRELEKGIEDEVKRLLKDPKSVLREMGLNPTELAELWLTEEVNELKKSPEQVEKERIERELNELRSTLKKRDDEVKQSQMLQLQEQEGAKLRNEIEDALKVHKTLPDNSRTRARIADAMLFAIENAEKLGIDASKVKVEDVIPTVEAEIKSELDGFLSELPEELFESYVGKKNLDKLKKKKLETIKQNSVPNINSVKATTKSLDNGDNSAESRKMRARDYFRSLGK